MCQTELRQSSKQPLNEEFLVSNFPELEIQNELSNNYFTKEIKLGSIIKGKPLTVVPISLHSVNKLENFFGYDCLNYSNSRTDLHKINEEVEHDFRGNSNLISKPNDIDEINDKILATLPKIYKTGLVYDSLSEQEDAKREFSCYPNDISRDYKKFLVSKSAILFLLNLSIIINFYMFSFEPFPKSMEWYGHTTSILVLMVDLIVFANFVIGLFTVFDSNNFLRFKLSGPLKHLRREGFAFDILIAIPYDIIFFFACIYSLEKGEHLFQSKVVLSHFRWVKVISLFKLNDVVTKINHYFDLISNAETVVLLYNYAFYFHLTSCLWIYTSQIEFLLNGGGWIKTLFLDQDHFSIYIASLYFNFTTLFTVGYGDITAKTLNEYVCLVFILISSCLVYALLFSAISTYFTSNVKRSEIISQKKEILDVFSQHSKVPDDLRNKILSFYNSSFKIGNENKSILFDSLPYNLKYELLADVYGDTIKTIKFFKRCSEDFSFYVLSLLKPLTLEKEELLLGVGSNFTDVYFVLHGQLNFYIPSFLRYKKFFFLKAGDNFGEVSILENELIDYRIVSTKKKETELLLLSKNRMLDIKNNYPELFKEKIKQSLEVFKVMEKNKLQNLSRMTMEVQKISSKKVLTKKDLDMSLSNEMNEEIINIAGRISQKNIILRPPCEVNLIANLSMSPELTTQLIELQSQALSIFDVDSGIKKTKKRRIYNKKTILFSNTFEYRAKSLLAKSFQNDVVDYWNLTSQPEANGVTIKLNKVFAEDNANLLNYVKSFQADVEMKERKSDRCASVVSNFLISKTTTMEKKVELLSIQTKPEIVALGIQAESHHNHNSVATKVKHNPERDKQQHKNAEPAFKYPLLPPIAKRASPSKGRNSVFMNVDSMSSNHFGKPGLVRSKASSTFIDRQSTRLKHINRNSEPIIEVNEEYEEPLHHKHDKTENLNRIHQSHYDPSKMEMDSLNSPSTIINEKRQNPGYLDDLIKDENINREKIDQSLLDSYVKGILEKEKACLSKNKKMDIGFH